MDEPSLALRLLFGAEALAWAGLILLQLFIVCFDAQRRADLGFMIAAGAVISLALFACSGVGMWTGRALISGLVEGWLSWALLLAGLPLRLLLWLIAIVLSTGVTA